MKKYLILVFVLLGSFVISSCSSIYDTPLDTPEVTYGLEIDTDLEYYTTGSVYNLGNRSEGFLYEGCWIYIETRPTIAQIGEKGEDRTPIYGESDVQRIVKYNPVTGTVSSPCLNPNCNHSLESGCPMLFPKVYRQTATYRINGIYGDWMVIRIKLADAEYRTINEERLYNLKTGELRLVYNEDLGSEVLTRWQGGCYYDGKYYRVKYILDYSKTNYKPGIEGESIRNYVPETKCILCEYDFAKDKTTELFEVPVDYNIVKITNKRFFFGSTTGEGVKLSCNKDGTNMKEEPSHDLGSTNLIGTYTYDYLDNGFAVHDLITDEIKVITYDFTMNNVCCVTDTGILVDRHTTYDEWLDFDTKEYRKEHPDATADEVNAEAARIMGSGNAQIWISDFMGDDHHMIYEKENTYIETVAAQGDYIFVIMTTYDLANLTVYQNPNGGRCVINYKTGEITEIPYLDIVVPDWYVNIK